YIPLLGSVEDKIIECFRNGGGVPYTEYKRFHQVMAEDSGQSVVSSLIEHILPLAPGVIDRLRDGIDVLDVGCGAGRALHLLGRSFPNSRFIGYDLSSEAIATARTEASNYGLRNVRFEEKDLTDFDVRTGFSLITAFDAIHDQAKPDRVLSGISRSLRNDGTFLMQDIAGSSHVHKNRDHPVGPLLYTVSCMHCMSVSLAQNGAGLGAMWGEEKALEMLKEAGFSRVEVKKLSHDFQNNYYIVNKS
ncbi:MAG: class I SAM-dependent methyltransferase, partial [Bacteroidetes bacterium]|nr:class I SAM-dependent methyltransferase [Bacteroidota bacterium]